MRQNFKKWKKEVNWWMDGGSLWYYDTKLREWHKHAADDNLTFYLDAPTSYVIGDKHVEARKAFALGKIIEFKVVSADVKNWVPTGMPDWEDKYVYRERPDITWKPSTQTAKYYYVGSGVTSVNINTSPLLVKALMDDYLVYNDAAGVTRSAKEMKKSAKLLYWTHSIDPDYEPVWNDTHPNYKIAYDTNNAMYVSTVHMILSDPSAIYMSKKTADIIVKHLNDKSISL